LKRAKTASRTGVAGCGWPTREEGAVAVVNRLMVAKRPDFAPPVT